MYRPHTSVATGRKKAALFHARATGVIRLLERIDRTYVMAYADGFGEQLCPLSMQQTLDRNSTL